MLTKRPENIKKMLPPNWRDGWDNVWLGTTAEDQANYDRRWPILRAVPARVKFISYEPAIGQLQLFGEPPFPDWFICGGESGQRHRDMDSDWARQVKSGCEYHDIPFFMKQMAGKKPIPDDLKVRQFPIRRNHPEIDIFAPLTSLYRFIMQNQCSVVSCEPNALRTDSSSMRMPEPSITWFQSKHGHQDRGIVSTGTSKTSGMTASLS